MGLPASVRCISTCSYEMPKRRKDVKKKNEIGGLRERVFTCPP
jgi:hypothetical protein